MKTYHMMQYFNKDGEVIGYSQHVPSQIHLSKSGKYIGKSPSFTTHPHLIGKNGNLTELDCFNKVKESIDKQFAMIYLTDIEEHLTRLKSEGVVKCEATIFQVEED